MFLLNSDAWVPDFQVFDLKFGFSTSEIFQGTIFEVILRFLNFREFHPPDFKIEVFKKYWRVEKAP